ncbi:MAG TPA: M48 family metalloprotease [Bryobacteraceae bacterium]|nr:M48 family metalloprotease [Bryobacteraceae bacterium]
MSRVVCLLALLAVASAQERPPGKGVNFYSLEKEAALGAQLAAEVRKVNPPLESGAVTAYIGQIGRRLAAQLPPGGVSFTFAAITGPAENHEPIALPGGYIFVPSSLILAAQGEAEFAGMLAHAVAHVAERHGTRLATRGELANLASLPLIYMGGWTGSTALPLGFVNVQRQLELEADRLAVRLMAGAGWDPAALARYIERVQPAGQPAMTSPLPARDLRVAALNEAIGALPAASYEVGEGLGAIQEEVRRLVPQPARPALK